MRWTGLLGIVCALAAGAAAQERPSDPGNALNRLGLAKASDRPMVIESDELEARVDAQGRDWVIFQKNVRVRQGEMSLHCDWLEAVYPKRDSGRTSGGKPERITARGDVRIEQSGGVAHCTQAVFENQICSAVCVTQGGQAQLERSQDRITADRIVFDLCTGVLKAVGNVHVRTHSGESDE